MAYNFPDAPTNGQVFQKWTWSSATGAWLMTSGSGGGGVGVPSDANPIMDSTAAPGTATSYSRGDHVHPSDTSRVAKTGDIMTGGLTATEFRVGDTVITPTYIELGSGTAAGPSLIDFHSSGTAADFDARIICHNGTVAGAQGDMNVYAKTLGLNAITTTKSLRVDAGTVDGGEVSLASAGFSDWNMDNVSGAMRFFQGGNVVMSLANGGTSASISSLTVNGALATGGNIPSSGAITGTAIGVTGLGNVLLNGGSNNLLIRPGGGAGATYFQDQAGTANWASIGSTGINTNYAIYASGTIGAGGTITAGGAVTANNYFVSSTAVAILSPTGAGNVYFRPNGAGSGVGEASVSGTGLFTTNGGITSTTGNLTMNGNITAKGEAGYAYYVAGATTTLNAMTGTPSGGSGQMSFLFQHFPGVWYGHTLFIVGVAEFQFRHDYSTWKSGGSTSWQILSDERIKTVKEEYTTGLDAIAALRPVRYTLNGKGAISPPSAEAKPAEPDPHGYAEKVAAKEYIGLIAQEAEGVLPDCFTTGVGYLDGKEVQDMRSAEYTALFFTLVNAVKELKARVEALEAG